MISRHLTGFIKNYKINTIIKVLIVSDFLIWSANQLFSPIFSIFIVRNLPQATLETVGFSVGIYLFTKSIFEIPVGIYVDKKKGESDDLFFAFLGTLFTGIIIFLFNYIETVNHLYVLKALLGLSAAIAYPGWYAIFTKHIDKNKEAFEWSLYDVLLALGMALSSALGGMIAKNFGFSMVFTVSSIITTTGAFLLLVIRKKIK